VEINHVQGSPFLHSLVSQPLFYANVRVRALHSSNSGGGGE
jgi:hypothetical protein